MRPPASRLTLLSITIGLAVGVGLLATPLAMAGTASVDGGRLVYRAAEGERNAVTIAERRSPDSDRIIEIVDTAGVIAEQGCARETGEDPTLVVCTVPEGPEGADPAIEVLLGSGSDAFLTPAPVSAGLRVEGGQGDDTLDSGPNGGDLDGGGGSDVLTGGQRMSGGPGPDTLRAGAQATSQLFGDDGDDLLEGGPGVDELNGGEGGDVMDPGAGRDKKAIGGPGDDTIAIRDGIPEAVACGGGVDSVNADLVDNTREMDGDGTCESVRPSPIATVQWPAALRGRLLRLPGSSRADLALLVRCSAPCTVSARAGDLITWSTVRLRAAGTAALRPRRVGRVSKRTPLELVVRYAFRDIDGTVIALSQTFRAMVVPGR